MVIFEVNDFSNNTKKSSLRLLKGKKIIHTSKIIFIVIYIS